MTMRRRQFIGFITTSTAFIIAEFLVSAFAQEFPNKPYVKRSEIKPAINEYVEKISQSRKEHIGVELSKEQKATMANEILSKMELEGSYYYVDP